MTKKKTVEEKISDALDIEAVEPEIVEEPKEIQKSEPKAIEVSAEVDMRRDYKHARRNLRDLIKTGNSAIEGILNVASEGEHPRAYEVAAQLIKVVADTNKDLIDLHKKVKDINREDVKLTQNNTNNAIYVGSTSELQNLISGGRSQVKQLKDDEVK
jgi:hypothetical protein